MVAEGCRPDPKRLAGWVWEMQEQETAGEVQPSRHLRNLLGELERLLLEEQPA